MECKHRQWEKDDFLELIYHRQSIFAFRETLERVRDADFPTLQDMVREVEAVLLKYPKFKIIEGEKQ